MNKLPIIAFAPHPWEENQWMNRQHILSRLAERGWPVYYCTGALNWWEHDQQIWNEASVFPSSYMVDGVTIVKAGKLLPTRDGSPLLTNLSQKLLVSYIKKIANITNDNFIALLFHPKFEAYLSPMQPKYLHLHVYDLYWRQPGWTDMLQQSFIRLAQASQLITAPSDMVLDEVHDLSKAGGKLLLNGADVSAFIETQPEPADLAAIPHPRIANMGTLNSKMDLELLLQLAQSRPNHNWVFVGRLEEAELLRDSAETFNAFRSLPNVFLLGEKHRTEIPAYSQHVDVLTMCYKITKSSWAYAAFPLKMVEALASGKPVVSVPLKTIVQYFSDTIVMAEDAQQWRDALDAALLSGADDTAKQRIEAAKAHSWDERVDLLEVYYQQMFL